MLFLAFLEEWENKFYLFQCFLFSIQRCSVWVLEKYYCDFSVYNPALLRTPSRSSRLKQMKNQKFKVYDVDGGEFNVYNVIMFIFKVYDVAAVCFTIAVYIMNFFFNWKCVFSTEASRLINTVIQTNLSEPLCLYRNLYNGSRPFS